MADFTPTFDNYTGVKPFRYWVQTVIPLVYDDSLSYYELLAKVVDYLNKVIEDNKTMIDNIDSLLEAYTQLQAFVNDYFDNLDVQEEINNKLDDMAQSGELTQILYPLIAISTANWLSEHITPTSPAIDNTLTVSGAGADSKTVGDIFGQVKSAITETTGLVYPYQNTQISFSDRNADNSFDVYFTGAKRLGCFYYDNTRFRWVRIDTPDSINIPNDYHLILDKSTNALKVINASEFYILNQNYIMLLYNDGVDLYGQFGEYRNNAILNSLIANNQIAITETTGLVYPYEATTIGFSNINADYSMDVTFGGAKQIGIFYYGDNRFRWLKIDTPTTINIPRDYFLVIDKSDNTIKVVSSANYYTLNKDYIVCGYNDGFNLYGQFGEYRNNDILNTMITNNQKAITETTGLVYPYLNTQISFSDRKSDNSFDVYFSGTKQLGCFYYDNNRFRWVRIDTPDSINIPNDYHLVINKSTNTLNAISSSEFYNLNQNYVTCLYNGTIGLYGKLAVYVQSSSIKNLNKYSEDIPPYYVGTYIDEKINTINTNNMDAGFNGFGFIFITDMHWRDNAKNSPNLIRYIKNNTNIKTVLMGGDYINWETTKIGAINEMIDVVNLFQGYNENDYLVAVGNHEYNDPGASQPDRRLTESQIRNALGGRLPYSATCDDDNYQFYVDDDFNKVRYIVTSNSYSASINPDIIPFVLNSLQDVKDGYSVIVLTHGAVAMDDSVRPLIATLCEGMNAYNNRNSYTYSGVTYDFSNAVGEVICLLSGDTHGDLITSSNNIPIIVTMCDCYTAPQQHPSTTITRTLGTVTEQAFDVVVIDKANRQIKMTRIGAGNDRVATY